MKKYITEFGAIGDGKALNTDAIQKTVDACAVQGGGTVVIPSGIFVSGTVELKSNITLYLEQGAVLKGSENLSDYYPSRFVHNEMGKTISILFALDKSNIRITGEGMIDLSGDAFMDYNEVSMPKSVNVNEMSEKQIQQAAVKKLDRPTQPIFFDNCKHMQIDSIKVCNAPCWTITFSTSCDIKVHNITINNGLRVPNSDGIHLCACKDVIVSDCVFSCGDDCVAITGITNWDGISERIIVSNCTMRSQSAGVRIGHLASKVRDVIINNLIVYESNRGLAMFASNDGWVQNITVANLILDTRIYAGNWWGKGEPLVICAADSTGSIEDIFVSNVKARCQNGVLVVGTQKNVKNVTLKDWTIKLEYGDNQELFGRMLDLQPSNMRPAPEGGIAWLYASDVGGFKLENVGADANDERVNMLDAVFEDVDCF